MSAATTLALVINTYCQPDYLARVLTAVSRQTTAPDEVLLADDGSDDETRAVFGEWPGVQSARSEHVWHKHDGFRRSRILNAAIAHARSDYVVFLDGDTLPHPRFVADHQMLAEAGHFVQGHRALIGQGAATWFGKSELVRERRRALWSGQLRGWKHAFRWPRPWRKVRSDLRGIRGCNLGVWRADLVAVNGYNEAFVGWGREDSELAVRLMNLGRQRLDVRGWALCYHLWHPPASRASLPANDELLERVRREGTRRCGRGLNRPLASSW